MYKFYFFIKRRLVVFLILAIGFSLLSYSLISRKDFFYNAKARLVFIGDKSSFAPEIEYKRIKEDTVFDKAFKSYLKIDKNALKNNISLELIDGRYLDVSYASKKPSIAKKIVNDLCSEYIRDRQNTVSTFTKKTSSSLSQLSALIESLQYNITSLEKDFREKKESNLTQDKQRTAFNKSLAEYSLKKRELLQIYTAQHPDVMDITFKMNALKAQLNELPDNSLEYFSLTSKIEDLKKELSAKEKKYTTLYENYKKQPDPWRVEFQHEAFLPSSVLGKSQLWFYSVGFSLSFLVALFIAVFFEIADKKIYTKLEAEDRISIPVVAEIGNVAHIRSNSKKNKKLLQGVWLSNKKLPDISKRFEQLYTYLKVEFFKNSTDGKILTVASAEPKTGKTFIAYNLAVAAAKNGQKTLLIDADLRNPCIGSIFNLNDIDKGLTDVLRGSIDYKKAIRNITDILLSGKLKAQDKSLNSLNRFNMLLSGGRISNPLNLLDSDKLKNLLELLRKDYDFIIIDTPAADTGSELYNISTASDAAIIVSKRAQTKYPAVKNMFKHIKNTKAEIIGMVLTYV